MPALDTITIQGFKSIPSIERLELGAINLVIGPNGSGKSNFIGVFAFLKAIREGRLQEYVVKAGGAEKVLHFGSKVTRKLRLHLSFERGVNQYEIELQPMGADQLCPTSEAAYASGNGSRHRPAGSGLMPAGKEAAISGSPGGQIENHVRSHLAGWRLYHFHDTGGSSPMKKTADVNDNRYLRSDGANLAAFLYYLRKEHAAAYNSIRHTVQQVAPFFEDFQLEPQKLNPQKLLLEWKHKGSEGYFDAAALSDGTLRFIALATLFLQPESCRPSVILVDEPELGLHPSAITPSPKKPGPGCANSRPNIAATSGPVRSWSSATRKCWPWWMASPG
jgi:predicted ATPase